MNAAESAKMWSAHDDPLSYRIIGAAIEVHRLLGPGLLESAYEECLCLELSALAIPFERHHPAVEQFKRGTSWSAVSVVRGQTKEAVVLAGLAGLPSRARCNNRVV